MLTLMQFMVLYQGQYAKAPGGDGGQCVDLANLWAINLGQEPVRANAADWPAQADRRIWLWTLNTPLGIPPEGAIVVFRPKDAGAGTGPAGHISIATSLADAGDLYTFDQDWPYGAPCGLVFHRRYAGVAGWLTLRKQGKGAT